MPDNGLSAIKSVASTDCRTSSEYSNIHRSQFNYPSKDGVPSSSVSVQQNITLTGDRDNISNCTSGLLNVPSHSTISPKFQEMSSNFQVYSDCLQAAGQLNTPCDASGSQTVRINPLMVADYPQCVPPHNVGTLQSSVPSNSGDVRASSSVLMDCTSIPADKQSSSTHSVCYGGCAYQESRGYSVDSQSATKSAPSEEPAEVKHLLECSNIIYVDLYMLTF